MRSGALARLSRSERRRTQRVAWALSTEIANLEQWCDHKGLSLSRCPTSANHMQSKGTNQIRCQRPPLVLSNDDARKN
jgi:hypothetical protein